MPKIPRRKLNRTPLAVERLDDRCVPAVITEVPFSSAVPTPQGVVAGPGGVWFTEPGANKIGLLATAGGVTEYTLATPLSDPRGIALGADGALWFTLFGTDAIGRIDPATGIITEFPLATGAGPSEITSGPDGRLWFTNLGSDSIGAITTTGVVSDFPVLTAGDQPFGITSGADGRLWFTQFGSNQIGAITTAGVLSEFAVTNATSPGAGITLGPDGNVWFGSTNGSVIGRITTAGVLTEFAGFGNAQTTVLDIVAGPDGALWFTQGDGDRVGRIATSGTVTNEFDTTGDGTPTGIATSPDGNLYFTEVTGAAVTQLTTAGVQASTILLASSGPTEIVGTTDGSLWYTQSAANKIGRVTAVTNAIVEFSLPTPLSDPRGITVGPDGNVWFTEFGSDRIGRITPTGTITEFSTGLTVGAGPRDIVAGPDGALWFTEAAADQIGRISTTGTITEFAVPGAGSVPFEIVAGPDGRLWFTQNGSDEIGAITTAGVVSEFAVPGAGSEPLGIAAGPDGALWFTQFASSEIGRISTDGDVTEFPTATAAAGPTAIVAAPDGRLWFTEATLNQLAQISTSGVVTESANGLSAGAGLAGITLLPSNQLAVAETTANQIATVALSADLSITKTDGQTSAVFGSQVSYTIVVSNPAGGDLVSNALVTDMVPGTSAFTGVSWTAVFTGGASGTTSGFGSIVERVTLPAGSTVTYTLSGTVGFPAGFGPLSNTATVSAPPIDPVTTNNTATDTTTIIPGPVAAPSVFAVGVERGTPNRVRVFDNKGAELYNVTPFDPGFTGGVRTAMADFNADGVADLVVGTGPGVRNRVRVLDGKSQAELFAVTTFEESFTGGVYVSAGDLNGDSVPDLVISPDEGGGPRVDIYLGGTFTPVGAFFAIEDLAFRGGVRTAVGDVNRDTRADLAVAAGFGGGPRIAVYDGTTVTTSTRTKLFGDFFAFEDTLRNGAFVAVGDVDGDGFGEVIAGAGPGGGPRVSAFNPIDLLMTDGKTLTRTLDFFAGDPATRGGVRLAVKNLDGDNRADLVTGSGIGAGARITAYLDGTTVDLNFTAFTDFVGGVFVG